MRLPRTTAVRPESAPAQARVITPGAAPRAGTGILPSTVNPSGICEIACNALPEPYRSICKAAC